MAGCFDAGEVTVRGTVVVISYVFCCMLLQLPLDTSIYLTQSTPDLSLRLIKVSFTTRAVLYARLSLRSLSSRHRSNVKVPFMHHSSVMVSGGLTGSSSSAPPSNFSTAGAPAPPAEEAL